MLQMMLGEVIVESMAVVHRTVPNFAEAIAEERGKAQAQALKNSRSQTKAKKITDTPESAILSAVIFNALVIIGLIPLALRGVKYEPVGET